MFFRTLSKRQNQSVKHDDEKFNWPPELVFDSVGISSIQAALANNSDSSKNVVLDFGGPCQAIVDSFGSASAKIVIVNLFESLSDHEAQSNPESDELDTDSDSAIFYDDLIGRFLIGPDPTPVSVILTWDIFNYLSRTEIISLMSYLSPYCHKGTLLFSISWLTESIPSIPGNFDLTMDGEVIYTLSSKKLTKAPEYSARKLMDMMPSFEQYKLAVTKSGMLEMILEFQALENSPNPKTIPASRLMAFNR